MNNSPLKILWMIPKWTLPATDGARVATDSLIRNTIAAGATVDVLCLPQFSEQTNPEEMLKAWGARNVFIIHRDLPDGGLKKILYYIFKLLSSPLTPLTFSSFSTKILKKRVLGVINQTNYDLILLDGLHLGAAILADGKFKLGQSKSKVVYRAHNIEVDLWKKAYKEKISPIFKLILFLQSKLVEKFELQIINSSNGIAAISQEDLDEISKMSKVKAELVPLGLNFEHPLNMCTDKHTKFLFIGRLDWPPNRDGLEWILKEVWPAVIKQRPEAKLKIVGSGNKSWLQRYKDLEGVQIVGFVDSIRDAYQDCHFTIVPITYGSGTRIKVIESFSLGRRLISTKMGVQGADLGPQDYINVESTEDWIKVLSTISLDKTQQEQLENSQKDVAAKFGEKNIGLKFYRWLKTL